MWCKPALSFLWDIEHFLQPGKLTVYIYIASPVTDITGKRESHRWKDVENITFTESRDKLCSPPVRLHPIFDGVHEALPKTYASGVNIDTSAEWQKLCDMTREGSSCCSFGYQPLSAVSVGTVV